MEIRCKEELPKDLRHVIQEMADRTFFKENVVPNIRAAAETLRKKACFRRFFVAKLQRRQLH